MYVYYVLLPTTYLHLFFMRSYKAHSLSHIRYCFSVLVSPRMISCKDLRKIVKALIVTLHWPSLTKNLNGELCTYKKPTFLFCFSFLFFKQILKKKLIQLPIPTWELQLYKKKKKMLKINYVQLFFHSRFILPYFPSLIFWNTKNFFLQHSRGFAKIKFE